MTGPLAGICVVVLTGKGPVPLTGDAAGRSGGLRRPDSHTAADRPGSHACLTRPDIEHRTCEETMSG